MEKIKLFVLLILVSMLVTAQDKPLVTNIYTADPSAHVFDGRIYIYVSHDIESGVAENDNGDHFDMRDYHVLSMDDPGGKAEDLGVAIDKDEVPWVGRQMWAPDAVFKDGRYYLYFPAKDKADIFRIGVAVSESPEGPFVAEPNPIKGSYSIDPAVFQDKNRSFYMYYGGIWGGQLQKYRNNTYDENNEEPEAGTPAQGPMVARMSADMLQFDEKPREIQILDEAGNPLLAGDNDRRFFEGPWMHTYQGKYYLTYSTGDTHYLCYATGDNPYGPFTYQGRILDPVLGWTTHHSIIEFDGKWYLFHHDSSLSGGKTHLRSVKVKELRYTDDGSIITIHPYPKK